MKFFQDENNKTIFAQTIIIAGMALILVGILNGEMAAVLKKAISICMECIGIG